MTEREVKSEKSGTGGKGKYCWIKDSGIQG